MDAEEQAIFDQLNELFQKAAGPAPGTPVGEYVELSDEELSEDTTLEPKLFEVWAEEFRGMGQQRPVFKVGQATARNFKEACRIIIATLPRDLRERYNDERNTLMGARLLASRDRAIKRYGDNPENEPASIISDPE